MDKKLNSFFVKMAKLSNEQNEYDSYLSYVKFDEIEERFHQKIEPNLTCFKREYEKYGARTLSRYSVEKDLPNSKFKVYGKVNEDYYYWVNFFCAVKKDDLSKFVVGDFENTVWASDEETLNEFLKEHPFEEWDYQDI